MRDPVDEMHVHLDGEPVVAPVLLRMSDVQSRPLRWLWQGRIPAGKITLLDGDPGLGKSMMTGDLAARVSTGGPMPDDTRGDIEGKRGVVIVSAEDDPEDTIRPRLDAAGADCSRITLLTGARVTAADGTARVRMVTLGDVAVLRQAIEQIGAALVVIDPLMAYLPGDAHKDQEVRQSLAPVAEMAAQTGAAVLVVRHLNKSSGSSPLYRGGGSIGIIGAARSGLLVAKDPGDPTEERRIVAVTKANLAVPSPSLAYRIETAGGIPRVRWEGPTDHTARDLLAVPADSEERSATDEAREMLLDLLAEGPTRADVAKRQLQAAGIADKAIRRAREALGIKPKKRGLPGSKQHWEWALPDDAPKMPSLSGGASSTSSEVEGHLRRPLPAGDYYADDPGYSLDDEPADLFSRSDGR